MGIQEEMKSQLSYQVIDNFSQFRELKQEWDALAKECVDTVFLTHEWLSIWWEYYGRGLELLVWTARHAGRLVGALPLVSKKNRFGFRRLLWMGFGEVTPNHLQAILDPQYEEICLCAITDFLVQVGRDYHCLDLEKIPLESRFFRAIYQGLEDAGFQVVQWKVSHVPYLEADDFDTYFKSRTRSVRYSYRRKHRRLERGLPAARFRKLETQAEVDLALNALIVMHQSRYNKKGFIGAFFSPEMRAFHRAFTKRALQSGALRMYSLDIDEKPIAVRYELRVGNTQQFYQASFNEAYHNYGPGILLHGYTIQQAMAEGIHKIDFLEGEEKYKLEWATGFRDNVRLSAYNPNLRGKLALLRDSFVAALRRLALRFLPAKIRRPIRLRLKQLLSLPRNFSRNN